VPDSGVVGRLGGPPPTIAGTTLEALGGAGLQAPLVSIVVIAWNHERYVGETIESIRRQDYPSFECIVVDNGSTDATADVVDRAVGGDPRFTVLRRQANAGQLVAFLEVFERLRGEFIMVVDSDDVLLANAVSVHLQVHLALDGAVGLTSAMFLQTDEAGRVLLAGGLRPRPQSEHRLIESARALRLPSISEEAYQLLDRAVVPVRPTSGVWPWSPGTANMYRRSAMALVRPVRPINSVDLYLDAHFLPLCSAMMGSALIYMPLSTYRLHGGNVYVSRVAAPMVHTARPEQRALRHVRAAERCAVVLRDPPAIVALVDRDRYWRVLGQALARLIGERADGIEPPVLAVFAEGYARLVGTFGTRPTLRALTVLFPAGAVAQIITGARGRRPSLGEAAWLATLELEYRLKRGAMSLLRHAKSRFAGA
jgi:hypothetical protein